MRLYAQIYAAILTAITLLVLAAIAAGILWFRTFEPVPRHLVVALQVVGERLPPASAPPAEQAAAVVALSERMAVDIELFSASGAVLQADRAWDPPPRLSGDADWLGGPVRGLGVRLDDGRILVIAREDRSPLLRFLISVAVIGGLAAVVAWPVSRRISRRVEALTDGVSRFGDDLSVRIPVEGGDEVAALAVAFNRSADRIGALVDAQRRVLASASHELRSPLARLRMAVELLGEDPGQEPIVHGAVRDLEELDALIADLLLAGRAGAGALTRVPVDLGALARAEAPGFGATVEGEGRCEGDPAALRRLLRNLLENARRYGAPPISVTVGPARLTVRDGGPGVPEAARERIFEPFYRPDGHAEGRDGGVGLGLALVREIARAHGGGVTCEGASFVVRLRL